MAINPQQLMSDWAQSQCSSLSADNGQNLAVTFAALEESGCRGLAADDALSTIVPASSGSSPSIDSIEPLCLTQQPGIALDKRTLSQHG